MLRRRKNRWSLGLGRGALESGGVLDPWSGAPSPWRVSSSSSRSVGRSVGLRGRRETEKVMDGGGVLEVAGDNRARDATQGSSFKFDLVQARSLVRPMERNLYMGRKWV
jgi:hypothetical protein